MLRLGVIGYGGRIGDIIANNLRRLHPDVQVVGVVDPDEGGARGRLAACDRDAAFYPTLPTLVQGARPDALLIGTRCNLHTPYAIEAAQYDLPLFLEKPVATSLEQAIALEAAFEGSRCPVVVSFPLRVSPLCAMTQGKLNAGAVGRPEHIMAVNYVPYGMVYYETIYRHYPVNQGQFLQKATHDFDYMMCLMGAPIVRVAAMAQWGRVMGGDKPADLTCAQCGDAATCLESPEQRRRNNSGGMTTDHLCVFSQGLGTPETGMNEDASSALVEFANGAQGVYTQVFYTRRDAASRGATISGYQGTLSFDWYTNRIRHVRHHRPFTDESVLTPNPDLGHAGGDNELAQNFLDVIQHGAASNTPITTGIQSAYACLAAKQSAETGQFVQVRQVGQMAGV